MSVKARRFFISDSDLLELYVGQHLSSRKIAEKYGVHNMTVIWRLRKTGVPLRGQKKAPPDSKHLVSLYEEGLSAVNVAKKIGCSPSYVTKTLARLGITRRRCGSKSSPLCRRAGCNEPAFKFSRGKWECGSLCVQHLRERTAKSAREMHRRIKELPVEFWRRPEDIPQGHPKREDLIWIKKAEKSLATMRNLLKETSGERSVPKRAQQISANHP